MIWGILEGKQVWVGSGKPEKVRCKRTGETRCHKKGKNEKEVQEEACG
jgi:hypothetical protein